MLPQGKAYQALYKRLSHINMIYKLDNENYSENNIKNKETENYKKITDENIDHYLNIFDKIHFKNKLNRITNSYIDNIKTDDEDIEENEEEELYEEEDDLEIDIEEN
jgi:hypothetical protein